MNDTLAGRDTFTGLLNRSNQAKVARHVGIPKTRVNRWAHGVSDPDVALIPKLAEYFGMSVEALTLLIARGREVGRAS